jgi:hypothetical protein
MLRTTFTPKMIAGLDLWLDAADESTLGNTNTAAGGATNNGPVKYWADKSGNGRHATRNAADSAVPTLLQRTRSGLSAVYFDGGDSIQVPSFQTFPSKRGTILAALNNRRTSGFGTICASPGGNPWQFYATTSGTNYGWWSTTVNTKSQYNPQAWHLCVARRSSDTAIEVRHNAVALTMTGTFNNNQPAANAVNVGSYNLNEYGLFDLGELLFFGRALSDAELLQVERYLAAKWSVAL